METMRLYTVAQGTGGGIVQTRSRRRDASTSARARRRDAEGGVWWSQT